MKFTTYFTNATACLLLFSAVSCEKMLVVDGPVEQLNTQQVFESVSTADAALSHLYSELQSGGFISGGSLGSGAVLGTYTDELISYSSSMQNATYDLYNNVQGSSNLTVKMVWGNAWSHIYMANAIIHGIKNSSTIPSDDQRRIKGEALLVRTLLYLQLLQIFGDIPYTTTTDYQINQQLKKQSETEILSYLRQDAADAAELLSDEYRSYERIYPNRKVAQMIHATVLLTAGDPATAEGVLRDIIASPLYEMETNLEDTFQKEGTHILWQLKPLYFGEPTQEALLYYFQSTLPSSFTLSDALVDSFAPGDLRKERWILPLAVNGKQYYRAVKYKNVESNTEEYSILYRLSEAYLMLAEAMIQQDKKNEALPYLNAVRRKAGLEPFQAAGSKQQMLDDLLQEYRHEFFTERGIRFTTLKRLGRLDVLSSTKPGWKTFHRRWPLPFSDLMLNNNLNPQNDGY
ncbi:RagB/SusD family nutrient uptake outer membrane protein [Chryseobacterium salipaludis]|uniref:RagB/SusD family nutrient uptake outer membrane protein n=1 Tax=Chryseobacterium TaxID=59732 RepID=UPI001FF6F9FE|nr:MULTISPECIES: RagB/SusD family nutrient uptake outer membrane protein [Chryseobacterium]MCJ8498614.1 RagB/SusD family nutrient uptake outer membrane protein [Chryseobacterium salipaludis]MCX3297736.1 RagB/SusD family nutrient uptake outer membrane protein [Planobacterium sp. JC490]